MITGGGSVNPARDNRIYVMTYDQDATNNGVITPEVLYYSPQLAGAVIGYESYAATGDGYRIFAVIDADGDGYGDGIQALVDDGNGSLTIDPAFDPDGAAPYVNYVGGAYGKLTWIKLIQLRGEESGGDPASDTRVARRLFCVMVPAGSPDTDASVYKMNADPTDLDGEATGNREYGDVIWSVASTAADKHSFRGSPQFTRSPDLLWVPMSDDPESDILKRVPMGLNVEPPSANMWTWPAADGGKNDIGPALSAGPGGKWLVFTAPSDGTRLISTTEDAGAGDARYVTEPLGDGTGSANTFPFRFHNTEYVVLGVGNRLEKIRDDGSDTVPDLSGTVTDTKGTRVTPSAPGEPAGGMFPKAIQGNIVGWVLPSGSTLYWAMDEGYVYQATWRSRQSNTHAEGDLPGFPLKLSSRVTWVYFLPWAADAGGLFIGTEDGAVVRIPLN
ncbi:MAG: hypothetical protein ACYTAF_10500 [Planctomycetota bacterium]